MHDILGTDYEPIQTIWLDGEQINTVFEHQRPLLRTIIQRYKAEIGQSGPFKAVHSPSYGRSDALDLSLEDKEGKRKETAPKHVGALIYMACSEWEDIAESVGVLCRDLN